MRGLKLLYLFRARASIVVASFTDAWIETLNIDNFVKAATSHLLQMRGLKPGLSVTPSDIERRIFYRCVD